MNIKRIRRLLKNSNRPPKIIIVRNDGLGDFILTMPLIASLKKQIPEARIYVLINRSLQNLIPVLADIEGAIVDDDLLLKRHRHGGIYKESVRKAKLLQLELEIKAYNFDMAILCYAEAKTAKLISACNIPIRVGQRRRPYFWRFNVYYKRSRRKSGKSEYLLNLSYLNLIGLPSDYAQPKLQLLQNNRIDSKLIVMHAYKKSSTAEVWPGKNFLELSKRLNEQGYKVVAIGDEADNAELKKMFKSNLAVEINTKLSLRDLIGLLQKSALFIGNSSGPLHMAALLNRPHIGFFPSGQSTSARRWRTLPNPKAPVRTSYLLSGNLKNEKNADLSDITVDMALDAMSSWGLDRKKTKSTTIKKKAVRNKKSIKFTKSKQEKKKTTIQKTRKTSKTQKRNT